MGFFDSLGSIGSNWSRIGEGLSDFGLGVSDAVNGITDTVDTLSYVSNYDTTRASSLFSGDGYSSSLMGVAQRYANGVLGTDKMETIQKILRDTEAGSLDPDAARSAISHLLGDDFNADRLARTYVDRAVNGGGFDGYGSSSSAAMSSAASGAAYSMMKGTAGLGQADNAEDRAGLEAFMAGKGMTQKQIDEMLNSQDPQVQAQVQALQAQLKAAINAILTQMLTSMIDSFKTTTMSIAANLK